MIRKISLIIASTLFYFSYGFSQCSNTTIEAIGDSSFCSYATGNLGISINTTIPNGPTYVWTPSTGLSNATVQSPSYSVTSTTSYTVKVTIKDNYNWINNGDFEQGNTGFTSGHGPGTGGTWGLLSTAGTYAVSTNPQLTHTNFASCNDHTSGAGNNKMMVVNGSPTANINVWCQSVPVNPNTNYRLVLWATSVVSGSPAILRFRVNGNLVGNSLTLSSATCTWQKLTVNWNSGNATNANICIRNQNTSGAGNDFALDDIQFKEDCVFRDTVVISVGDGFQKSVDTSICSGDTYFAAGQMQTSSGIYIDTLSTGGSCDSLLITNLTVVDNILNLGKDTSYCAGDSVILSANLPNATYLWNDNSTAASNLAINSGTYIVTVTSQEGCQKTDSINLTFNPNPQVDLGQDTFYCSGDSIELNVFNPQANYSWQDNSFQPIFTATASNLYSVTVTSPDGCENSDEVNLTFYAVPVVNLGSDSSYCDGDTILLDVSNPSATYIWQDNSTNANLVATTSDLYSVTVSGPGSCSESDSVNIQFSPVPSVDLGKDTMMCGGSLVLNAFNSNATYLWNNGNSDPMITVSSSGLYYVDVSIGNCEDKDSIIVDINPVPIVSITGPGEVCIGSVIQLEAFGGSNYLWSTGDVTSDIQILAVSTNWYSVEVSDSFCSSADSQFVEVTDSNQVEISGDEVICANQDVIFTATGTGNYLWSTGETSASITVYSNNSTTYSISAFGGACPDAKDTLKLTVISYPDLLLDSVVIIQPGESVVLNVISNADGISWSPNTDISCVDCFDPEVNPESSTYYTATTWFDSLELCKTIDSVLVRVIEECASFAFPSAFSPNGDQLNDQYRLLSYGGNYENLKFSIYNRWGDEVFQSARIDEVWDGTMNDKPVPVGAYVFSMSYSCDGQKLSEVGEISLIR